MSRMIQRLTLSLVIGLFTFLVLNLSARPIDAEGIITVGNGCSLIEAIQAANTDSPVGACATGNLTDTIILQANTVYTLTAIDNGSFNDYNGLPAITSAIVISGNGATVERSAASDTPDFRIFYVGSTGDLTLYDVTIRNGGFVTYGGGVHNDGTLTVNNSTFSDHSAYYGGGIWNEGTLTVTNSTLCYNSSTYGGGGIFNDSCGTLTVNNSTFSHNSAIGFGGGIYNAGTLTVNNSTLSHNSANLGGSGGGIKNEGVLTVSDSTLSHNSAYNFGGGIWNEGTLTVSNSTLSHNSAVGFYGFGGGIHNDGTLTVSNSTVANNRVDNNSNGSGSGGGICQRDGSASVVNTIIAGNTANNGGAPDCAGELTSSKYNLIQDTTGCTVSGTGNITGQDPLLGPLADNGGHTQTHALLRGSPAVDAGDPAFTPPPHFDQRGSGFLRVVGGRVDIGAFEWDLTYVYLPIVLKYPPY